MALCADAVARDGELVGDPTEGALVVLAAKGGVDPVLTRERYPRIAEVPFDAAYKFMATFHRMNDDAGKEVIRCYVKGAPDQLLARAKDADDGSGASVPVDKVRDAFLAENERLGREGLRVMATARARLRSGHLRPQRRPAPARRRPDAAGAGRHRRPTACRGQGGHRQGPRGGHPGAHDHGRPCRHRGGHRAPAGHHRARHHGRGVRGHVATTRSSRQIDDIGVIARVAPEDKVHLVDILKKKGHVVAMTGDGVNDAPALKRADIGVAMGITGTEVSKEAAVMILTDDNFATIVKAVELGRALYDNLLRYIRFQMAGLFGFIATFLGASIFFIAEGIPFTPLQTLWINFTVTVFLAIGLGYGQARAGLMAEKPRSPERPILPRRLFSYLAIAGLVIGASTLVTIWWATGAYGEAVARTMGVTVFSIANIWFAIETSDPEHSVFSGRLLQDTPLLKAVGLSVVAIIAANELGFLNRVLETVGLTMDQWLISIAVSLTILVVVEIVKALGLKPNEADAPIAPAAAPAAA